MAIPLTMLPEISFFNFSINKVLATECDYFMKAKIKIAFLMLIFTIFKIVITIPVALANHQYIQATRSGIIFVVFLALFKLLLYKPQKLRLIAHIVLITALSVIGTNLFFLIHKLNVVTVQMIITTVLCAFYLIGRRTAILYSALAIMLVLSFLVINQNINTAITSHQLVSPMYEINVILNFVSIAAINYFFYKAYEDSVKEKDNLNAQLAVKVEEVKSLADSKSMFLSSMSHELRTPLNAVLGITNLLKENAPAEQNEHLQILEFSTVSLLSMVNDILDYHKSENDKIELEAIPVNLDELLNKICSTLRLKANEKKIDLAVHTDERLKQVKVVSDPTRLTQIIYNLAGNAIKFTNLGSVHLSVKVIKETDTAMQVLFVIKDTGIGIPSNKLKTIFEPFTQASADTTRHFGGTGLGLAIVKKMVMLFNSSVQVKSEEGKGSEFSFNMDFNKIAQQMVVPKTPGSALQIMQLNVLIAEDNSINAMLLEKMLVNWGIKTTWAMNGGEVVSKLKAEAIDVILMDLQMPVMDGYETARIIRSLEDPFKANVPIVALTASISKDIYPQIVAAGMQDYLSKPYEAIALYEKLEKLASRIKVGSDISPIIQKNLPDLSERLK